MTKKYRVSLTTEEAAELVSVHKVGYFVDRPCIFSSKDYENAISR